ncbi:alpha,alpha-trehalose-phosphate synthase [Halosimplex carlsbadense 2-9-1]|uniref:Alpha,alpha-trehalose-phosphate synthase n=1 Tax=Halosimplex carlsbadense 2-9-1 TaxID=797114 RepID=M0CYA2_9EURY|nr:trehalose-6-phosphate synthase [Halosimplex carlsbadense]ELZ26869.1 alpha,alpha-trehalose-phosphate synthase [Halosimplex carlsbadense 2-9-1]
MPNTHLRADRVEADFDRLLSAAGDGLVVASNRQPYRHDYGDDGEVTVDRPAGGLTAGLDEVMRRVDGTWIAWGDGEADAAVVDGDDTVAVPPDGDAGGTYTLRRLWLDGDEVQGYYYELSNQVLWPLCHAALATVESCGDAWADYRRVNEQFADAMAAAATDADGDPLVWLHDYHLALAPRQLRERAGAGPTLAHTWHIPWPSWDTFRACPNRDALLDGLLGNDLLVFHVPRYCENFLRSADRGLDGAAVDVDAGTVEYRGRTTTVRAAPMGVPADRIREQAGSAEAAGFRAAFRKNRGIDRDTRLAVGVDRLDYTKGVVQRLDAFERLFADNPRYRGELTFVQIGTESRSAIPAYADYQERVEAAVDRVNDRFATDDWRPVVYTTDMISNEGLAGLYREADLGVVSPVRDGMNLVAQEYVAAGADDPGVLVLSDQAGVHDTLGEWAVSVRPHDTNGFAAALDDALSMPERERRRRANALADGIEDDDLDSWLADVLSAVAGVASADGGVPTRADH